MKSKNYKAKILKKQVAELAKVKKTIEALSYSVD